MLDGGRISQDQWEQPISSKRQKEVSNVVGDMGSLLKDKRSIWQKELQRKLEKRTRSSCFGGRVLADALKAQGNVDEDTTSIIIRGRDRIRRRGGERNDGRSAGQDEAPRRRDVERTRRRVCFAGDREETDRSF